MKKILIAIAGFYLGIIVFMPKTELYYKALEILDKNHIDIISKTDSNPFRFEIKNAKIYYLNSKTASLKDAKIYPFLFYNRAEIKDFKLNIGNYVIKNLEITYIPFLNAKIRGNSNFGELNGYINFKELKIYIKNPRADILEFLKKDGKGYYYYERF